MALLTHTAQVLQQMSMLLKCCPSEEVSLQEWSPLPQSMLSPLAMSFAGDVLVAEVKQALEVSITSLHSYMANPIRNRILCCDWHTGVEKMALSLPLGITRYVSRENSSFSL